VEIIKTVSEMQKHSNDLRSSGKTIAFVPTMGFFHEGHLELMRLGRKSAGILVISIFVNPTQFGPSEDLASYPQDPEGDMAKAKGAGVDIAFRPSPEEMYPEGFQLKVIVEKLTKHLCGLSRPGHFDGVATVVTKLFNIVKPHMAIFGQKDYQQLAVIKRMVMDLNMDIDIISAPTVREPDGLAMSSRNAYLNPEERKSASCLKKSIDLAQKMARKGERDTQKIKEVVESEILRHPYTKIDYIQLCNPLSLEEVRAMGDETLLALAVKVGETRLIDNQVLRA
jgi:pantoate--beta-alanine ligase